MARGWNALVAELVGTFLLVFIGGGAGILAPQQAGMLVPAFAHGLALFIIVTIIGSISGAHVNPAVTLGLASIGKFSWLKVPGYLIAQFIGAALGALAVAGIYGTQASVAPTLGKGVGLWTGVLAEALGAAILVITVVAAAADSRKNLANGVAGLAIGLALASAIFVVGPITGAGLNPALALSPYAVDAFFHHMPTLGANELAAYLGGPIVGGVVAAVLYALVSGMPGRRVGLPARQPAQAKQAKQPATAKKR
jgi:glycerol uptake facilitator protein